MIDVAVFPGALNVIQGASNDRRHRNTLVSAKRLQMFHAESARRSRNTYSHLSSLLMIPRKGGAAENDDPESTPEWAHGIMRKNDTFSLSPSGPRPQLVYFANGSD